ncbi:PREDICTED: GATA zinc finger domain-containing protein 8-like isoform X2 [Polistes canadensis]|uniref:GATA zinc finger domain-containing protein 8-like isoform X2 n=1 Tax=Polistes canadensis TaxID=91411 RepID=UPI000718BE91|nr:PREDICTED: GATA zinc finger domain-containing protein 8-like isoform X2 [Polistes canadensis]
MMRKSPLSMPGGSRRQNNHQCKSYGAMGKTNCVNVDLKREYYSYNGGGVYQGDNGFIPLNSSTPNEKKQYNNNRNIYPYFKYNSPHKHPGLLYQAQNKNMNNKQLHMSKYIDMKSILEDPWAELKKKLDNSTTSNDVNASDGCSSISNIKDSDNMSFCDTDFQNNLHNEQSQCQSIDARLEISDNASKPIVENLLDNKFGDTELNLISNNVFSCNATNDNNHVANKDDKQDI